ncbi:MAG: hypothetical protein RMJ67_05955 [Elusimicrobiota bacterium]|nr:hypothetical protein [Endomicrobiia bacterium]MDW8166036.1 hypothetical protein [Elusimicrobiota bacterium]
MRVKKTYRSITVPHYVYEKIIELKKEIDKSLGLDVKIYAVIYKAVQKYLDEFRQNKK